ncbi:hypothetical protein HEB94_002776 [Actinopolymorpha pittospori]|uniref:Uncharacterized protein n=1 Tax=Actinopolymorpha pittospori TaxID=648752 RepID=A0A927RJR3_9ACTN|nr:hypothetical protein [Actinopolymorpha pittospori]
MTRASALHVTIWSPILAVTSAHVLPPSDPASNGPASEGTRHVSVIRPNE